MTMDPDLNLNPNHTIITDPDQDPTTSIGSERIRICSIDHKSIRTSLFGLVSRIAKDWLKNPATQFIPQKAIIRRFFVSDEGEIFSYICKNYNKRSKHCRILDSVSKLSDIRIE